MSLKDAVIRQVAAEEDAVRRIKLAVVMLTGQEMALLHETFEHAMGLILRPRTTDQERAAAEVVVQALAGVLLGRVDAMDAEIERLLDEVVAYEAEGAEYDPPSYNPDEGRAVVLALEPDDGEDPQDLLLDLRAEPGRVYLTMRVPRQGVLRLTGWLPVEGLPALQRRLEIVAADAEAMRQDEEEADG